MYFVDWLQEVPQNTSKFKCKLCNAEILLKGGKQDVNRHGTSKKHLEKMKLKKSTTSVVSFLEQKKKDASLKEKIAIAEIKLSTFFADNNIAISLVDNLVPVIKSSFADPNVVNGISLGRTKTTKILNNVLCPVETNNLIFLLKNTLFSILVDESTDVGMDKYLCILVRYVCPKSGKLNSDLLKMLKLDATNTTADNIYKLFQKYMCQNEIPLKNIIGLASDGANVMLGQNNSFMSRLKSDTSVLVVMKCICHTSSIIASKACKVLPATPEDLLRSLSSYISASGKRSAQLMELQEFLNVSKKKILKLSSTRWLSLHQCVERVLELWNALQHFFLLAVVDDNLKQTNFIYEALNNDETKAYFLFLKYVLNFFNMFNALFQSRDVLVHQLAIESQRIYYKLCNNYLKADVINTRVECRNPRNFVDLFKIYLGPECNTFLENLNKPVQEKIRKKCLEFYIVSCEEIQKRLPLEEKFLVELIFIDPKVALSLTRPEPCINLTETIKKFLAVLDKGSEISTEWRDLQIHFTASEKEEIFKMSVPEFWHMISNIRDFRGEYSFKNIAKLAQLVMILPHSNAEAERIFSIMNDVKSKKRNRLESDTLNSLCVIRHNFKRKNVDASTLVVTEDHLNLMNSSMYNK